MGSRRKTKPASGPGLALLNKRKSDGDRFKTVGKSKSGSVLESVMEIRDLDVVLERAELAGRIFSASNPLPELLISAEAEAAVGASSAQRKESHKEEEALNMASLTVPRRPKWNSQMTAEELDAVERKSFLDWRRGLARLEENDNLVLTPFEKNLDVWRQLWRVLERSDLVVLIVDARNPLFYRCPDLEEYAREIDANKKVMLLLNKADLLTASMRHNWARYLQGKEIPFLFWSAKAASAELDGNGQPESDGLGREARDNGIEAADDTHVLGREELLERLQNEAEAIVRFRKESAGAGLSQHVTREVPFQEFGNSASASGKVGIHSNGKSGSSGERVVVGFVGYPNVGKSSTINALIGGKKTGVTSTPGKTKHFQTLIVNDKLMFCDCPGLVFPSFSASKAEMVACGVIPVDKLTDYRGPIQVVANLVSRSVLQEVYGIRLPEPKPYEEKNRPPTAAELLFVYAVSRGYFANSGLPDETRAARLILKDFTSGKLRYCILPDDDNSNNEAEVHRSGDSVIQATETAEEDLSSGSELDVSDDEEEDIAPGPTSTSGSLSALSLNEDGVCARDRSAGHADLPNDRDTKLLGVVDESGTNLDRVFKDLDSSWTKDVGENLKESKRPAKAVHKMQKKIVRKKDRSWRVGRNQESIAVPRAVQIPVSHGAADLFQVPASLNPTLTNS